MRIDKIPVGRNPPWDLNVLIEIPMNSLPVKYELEKESGAMFVDRFLHTAMYYPCNYGFLPHTLAEDGDPVDVLVAGSYAVEPGCVLRARPVGVLRMEDEAGPDEKIMSVPTNDLSPFYRDIKTYEDLPPILIEQVGHFFAHYKDLEKKKWVKITGWGGPEEAASIIERSMGRWSKAAAARRPSTY